jgi:hypothetical protein
MPLTGTGMKPTADRGRKAIGIWMENERGSAVRVFISYEALADMDPSQIRDPDAALTIFNANRARLENLASARCDAEGTDECEHEGQPILILRSTDIADQ